MWSHLYRVKRRPGTMWFYQSGGLRKNFVSLSFPAPVFILPGALSFHLPPHSSLFLISFFLLFSHISLIILAGPGGIGRVACKRVARGRSAGGRAPAHERSAGGRAQSDAVGPGWRPGGSIWWFRELVVILMLILWRTCDCCGDFLLWLLNSWLWFECWFL
jgi:hypothetical protein